ncbi:cyclophilin-like fold protein [Dyadobacter sp. CY312]|uniref:cyclophilin-like fold protein n=1 Tax=Dyadobacter sp. CY312 TaxID=2907303 RepID=UPI001EEF53B7|nr:cyclophilin-like fold protein [Dyadobacter sp. CY312]MCE7039054.1 hypothetical protein [Dyadobacter sp. CY312]
MKKSVMIFMQLALVFIAFMACKTDSTELVNDMGNETEEIGTSTDTTSGKLIVKVGAKTFTATLVNNATATAFKARLPLTVQMDELNGNEKLYQFPNSLPANPTNPGTIQNGDLMLYTSNVLVLFYKTFPTSYTYTRIGKVNDVAGLAAALGSGRVEVSFALE